MQLVSARPSVLEVPSSILSSDLKSLFDFFPFRVALRSFKYPYKGEAVEATDGRRVLLPFYFLNPHPSGYVMAPLCLTFFSAIALFTKVLKTKFCLT